MTEEGQNIDRKSLRMFTGKNPQWAELAKDCVCFANSRGGVIMIGVEDDAAEPPHGQLIPPDLSEKIQKRVSELTVNVIVAATLKRTTSGAEYIELQVPRSSAPASTTGGRFFLRVADKCKPLVGEEIQRLLTERSAQPWEIMTSLQIPRDRTDPDKLTAFSRGIRESERVKPSVKEKSDSELLDHYLLAEGPWLTNLGVLCVGRRADRAQLGTAPVIQFIKYDDHGVKVNKIVWDENDLSPMELVEAVWRDIPDFREQYELPDGLFR
jgi:ATP-dependent DNA helicase RecG